MKMIGLNMEYGLFIYLLHSFRRHLFGRQHHSFELNFDLLLMIQIVTAAKWFRSISLSASARSILADSALL